MFWKKKPKIEVTPNGASPVLEGATGLAGDGSAGFAGEESGVDPLASVRLEVSRAADGLSELKRRMESALSDQSASRRGGPLTSEVLAARGAAAASLIGASDPSARRAAEDIASGAVDAAFDTLARDAQAAVVDAADRWRRLGALSFGVDAARALAAYEQAFALDRNHFWTGIFLARLRGVAGETARARDAAHASLNCAVDEAERALARTELSVIAVALHDMAGARTHAEVAVAETRALLERDGTSAAALRDLVLRVLLLADVRTAGNDAAGALSAYDEALRLARRAAAADPGNFLLLRGVAEILEKSAALNARIGAADRGLKQIEEAVLIRRRLGAPGAEPDAVRALATSLVSLGDIRQVAGDHAGARRASEEGLATAIAAAARHPENPHIQRDVWVVLWRLAQAGRNEVSWRNVADRMQALSERGLLLPEDERFLGEAQRRAGR